MADRTTGPIGGRANPVWVINDDSDPIPVYIMFDPGDVLNVSQSTTPWYVGIQGYRSADGTYQPLRLDSMTNTIQVIEYEHHEIHAGSHFFVTDYQTINSGNSVDWLITAPNTTKWAHMVIFVEGTAVTTIVLYEGSDRTGSAALTAVNSNRNSATAATTTVHRGVAAGSTDGTAIWQISGGSATAQSRSGQEGRKENEIILKQNTKYNLKVTSGTAGNIVSVHFGWYEHTNVY